MPTLPNATALALPTQYTMSTMVNTSITLVYQRSLLCQYGFSHCCPPWTTTTPFPTFNQQYVYDITTNNASTTTQHASSHSPTPLPSPYQLSIPCRPWSTLQLPWYTNAPSSVSLGSHIVVLLGQQQHPSPPSYIPPATHTSGSTQQLLLLPPLRCQATLHTFNPIHLP